MFEDLKKSDFHFAANGQNNPMAGRWARFLRSHPAEKGNYAALSGHQAKAEFRRVWGEAKYKEFHAQKSYSERQESIDTSKGTYETLTRIAWLQGGGKSGLAKAKNHCDMCISLGKPWVIFNKFTRGAEFLYMRQGFEILFTKAWERRETYKSSFPSPAAASSAQGPAPGPTISEAVQQQQHRQQQQQQ
eukprot:3723773-Alexandrium_andersonii.AAC.1